MAARKTHRTRRHTTKRRTTKRHVRHHASVKTELGNVIKKLQQIKKAA